ncbi:MAG: response regulator [Proteobacteria bacterium]|nr:response regulator [Pseudomonadota bacterium]
MWRGSGMFGRILEVMRRGKGRSSYELLRRMVPAREFQRLAMATPDRRHLFDVVAPLLGTNELEIIRKIALQLGVSVIERPAPMDLELLSGCTVAELRSAAAVGVTGSSGLVGCVCLDPLQVQQLPECMRRLPRYMSTWSAIARALDESERALQAKLGERNRRQTQETREMLEGVLGIVIADTMQFGASRIEIDCSQLEPVYRFRTADGRTGMAPLNTKLHGVLKRYCEELRDSGEVGTVRLPAGKEYAFTVQPTIVQGAFVLAGVTDAAQLPSHAEPPQLHTIEGGKSERKVLGIKGEPNQTGVKKNQKARKPRVLVVDDNEVFANVLERFLGRMEIEVVYRSDGSTVVELLSSLRADLLICDVHMPGTPGFEVVKMVRASEQYRDLPVIMLTSDTDIETEVRLLNSGADAFVSKSEDPRVLCAHVHRLLVRAGKRKEAA